MDKLLQNSNFDQVEQPSLDGAASLQEFVDLALGFLRRQWPILVFITACAIMLGVVYLFTTPKQYTAHAMLLIDTSKSHVLQQQQQAFGDLPLDSAQVETQVELLKSEGIGLSVIKEMKLTEEPEFVASKQGLIGALVDLITQPFYFEGGSSQSLSSESALTRTALGRFIANRDIRRVARTYVLDISYTSLSASRAASVANATAEAYIVDQLESKFQATRRAGIWLQDRIAELRLQALTADRAVLEFREKKNIIGFGGSDGRLLGEQTAIDVNTQLGVARGETAAAKARLDRIQTVMSQDVPDAAVADSLRNEVLTRLRTQYLDLDRRYEVWAGRYGAGHLAAVNLKTQMAQLRRSMADELGRIAESYKSDYEIAKQREDALEKNLVESISGTQLTNRDRLGLQELESKAKVYHSIHDNFLQRYMEITQQQSFPITEARVITSATPPNESSSPKMFRVMMVAGVLGLILSFAAALMRETMDRVFRTSQQVEKILRTNCLAVLPLLKNKAVPAEPSQRVRTSQPKRTGPGKVFGKDVAPMFRHVLHEPLSAFAEGLRSIKIAAAISGAVRENKVIGITSTLPHEGKSTMATNLAELIASGGSKVILVDSDLRNPTLSRKLVSGSGIGLLEVLGGKCELHQAIYTDESSGLSFLPAVIESHLAHSSEILASDAFKQLIDGLRKNFDYVILDLPPLAPVVDVRATTKIVDSYVYVVEWGATRINMIQRQLNSAPEVYDRLLGVVLNKANMKILNRYENYYGRYYYKKYYARYGYTS